MSPRDVLVPYAITRALAAIVALIAIALLPVSTVCPDPCHRSANALLDAASRWDGAHYLTLARDGYALPAPGAQSELAFFPLYPFLMRLVGPVLGGSDDAYLAAGVAISAVSLAIACVYLARLVAIERGANTATRSVVYLLLFPTSVFLAAVYAESLFLALAIGAMYHARRGRWPIAAALAAFAALARPLGVLVVVPLAVELALQHERRAAAWLGLPLVAFAAWHAALWRMSGDPLAYLTAQATYGRHPSVPLGAFTDLADPAVYGDPWIVIALTVLTAALVAVSWRVLRPSLATYATVFFLASLATGTLTSAPRYYLVVFPVFVALAVAAPRWLGLSYVAIGAAASVLFTAMFALRYWVA